MFFSHIYIFCPNKGIRKQNLKKNVEVDRNIAEQSGNSINRNVF